jgi:hypothetical protein
MANLPPNMPVPVKQPPGGRLQITNYNSNLDCSYIIFNPNPFLIDIIIDSNPPIREAGGLLQFIVTRNQTSNIFLKRENQPDPQDEIIVNIVNTNRNNHSVFAYEIPQLEVFLLKTCHSIELMEIDIKEIKKKLEHIEHIKNIGDYK